MQKKKKKKKKKKSIIMPTVKITNVYIFYEYIYIFLEVI